MNPSFAVTYHQARQMLEQAAARPQPLDRPLVVIGGFLDPGIAAASLQADFQRWTGDNRRIIPVSLALCFDFDQCRSRIVQAVDDALGEQNASATAPVDVVAVSMGGLAARYAAAPADATTSTPQMAGRSNPLRRLNIVRLFTISAPMRGATLAEGFPPWMEQIDPITLPMRPGSAMLQKLAATPQRYPIYSYVRLRDVTVGAANAAADGQQAWWLPVPPMAFSHDSAFADPRILADILQRLHDQKPLSSDPPAPLPSAERTSWAG